MKISIYSLSFFATWFFMSCAGCQNRPQIVRFHMMDRLDTLKQGNKTLFYKSENFIVGNYSDTKKINAYIDSFATENKATDYGLYTQYEMYFFKASDITNSKHISETPRDFYRYSLDHDLIFLYSWIGNGMHLTRYKLKDGEIVEPKNNIIVTPLQRKEDPQP